MRLRIRPILIDQNVDHSNAVFSTAALLTAALSTIAPSKTFSSKIAQIVFAIALCVCSLSVYGSNDNSLSLLTVGPDKIKVEWSSQFDIAQRRKLSQWLTRSIKATQSLTGRFPCQRCLLRIQSYPASEPVPWASINREFPKGVNFYVNPSFSLADFDNDWTAVHEFSHWFIPFPGDNDLWFSEGLATYFQNLLRHQAGFISHTQMLQKLRAGFARGRSDRRYQDWNLDRLSSQMHKTRSFMRVYWSGVAYFLIVDHQLALRHKMRLTDVIAKFNHCCRDDTKNWTGSTLANTLDNIASTTLFSEIFKQAEAHTNLLDVNEAMVWLAQQN